MTHLNVGTIVDDLLLPLELLVICPVERGETPLLGDDDLLSSGELVSGTSESLDDDGTVLVFASDGHDDLATDVSVHITIEYEQYVHVDTGDGTVGFTPSTSHTLLQPVDQHNYQCQDWMY
jgi:hypothetical protein